MGEYGEEELNEINEEGENEMDEYCSDDELHDSE